ncbi:hypothetical protein [Victivallis vadensis]|uniref:hypothetical protein n=1 Tax=Victivallis vadensis TaxID=172901 RepID=UPI00266CFCD7|nr:hypothetical protein [Victivallis vadensis]
MRRKEEFYWLILFCFVAVVAASGVKVYWRNREYRIAEVIRLTAVAGRQITLSVPVKYIPQRPKGNFQVFPVSDRSRKNYVLHWEPRSGRLFFSIRRGEFGGFIIMNGNYRITDSAVEEKLLVFLKAHDWR